MRDGDGDGGLRVLVAWSIWRSLYAKGILYMNIDLKMGIVELLANECGMELVWNERYMRVGCCSVKVLFCPDVVIG